MSGPAGRTLLGLFEARARRQPDRIAWLFDGLAVSFGALWRRVDRFAAGLLRAGLRPGDRVLMALPNGGDFFIAFYGAQRAGGVAVPIFPDSGGDRLVNMAELSGARIVIIATSGSKREAQARRARARELTVLDATIAGENGPPVDDCSPVRPGDLSYLQYTSGSTGDPKGVRITHAMALANVEQMIGGMEITEDEVFVSWLPAHHDMGLVLMTMVPFYLAAKLVLLPASLTRVGRWLTEIERHRATFTAAPDFAYRLCLHRVRDPAAFDLSSLRVALDAAEPVRRRTIRDFEVAFGLSDVMAAGYGLAEATVGVTMSAPGRPVRADSHGVVSVGRPFPGVEVAILGDDGRRVPAGIQGEIAVGGPAVTPGYDRNERASARLFTDDGLL